MAAKTEHSALLCAPPSRANPGQAATRTEFSCEQCSGGWAGHGADRAMWFCWRWREWKTDNRTCSHPSSADTHNHSRLATVGGSGAHVHLVREQQHQLGSGSLPRFQHTQNLHLFLGENKCNILHRCTPPTTLQAATCVLLGMLRSANHVLSRSMVSTWQGGLREMDRIVPKKVK